MVSCPCGPNPATGRQVTDVNYPAEFEYLDTAFSYDELGNRTCVVDSSGTDVYTANVLNQYTEVADVNYTYDDAGNMTNDGRYEYVYDAHNRLVQVHNIRPLSAACDTDLVFTTGGDAEWFLQTDEYCSASDDDAARSGDISDGQVTWMQTTVVGPGTLKFYWKVSCETGSDYVGFYLDGQSKGSRAGNIGWAESTHTITGLGSHTLQWRYTKDGSGSEGEDCAWVDYVRWTPATTYPSAALANALDTDLAVYTGRMGDEEWYRTTWWPYGYGGDSAESGPVYDEQSAVMEAVGYGAGTVSFYWKVSSEEDCDYLEFYIDDELQDSVSGEVDWVQKQYNVSGSGAHVFRWQYVKDYSGDDGEDRAWVDYLQWTGAGEPPEQSGGWETVTYVYDPAGRRIAKAIDGDVAVRYLYDGDHVIAEYDGDDVLLRKFIYGPGVDQPICMVEAGGSYAGAYYYHFDGLGSVVALSDAIGDTVQTYEYSVFGEPAASDPNHPNPYLFTARRFDPETGLYHYRARAYNPYIGRFLQTDPIGYGDGMSIYAFCRNNPVAFVDPLGLSSEDAVTGYVYDGVSDVWYELHGQWDYDGICSEFFFDSATVQLTITKDGLPAYGFFGDDHFWQKTGTLYEIGSRELVSDPTVLASVNWDEAVGATSAGGKTALWALGYLGDKTYGYWGINSLGYAHVFSALSWKCNKFVYDAYTLGGDIPLLDYPVYKREKYQLKWWPITANQMASGSTQNLISPAAMGHFPAVGDLRVGDVIAIPQSGQSGHMGIYIGNGQMIQAGRSGVVITTLTESQIAGMVVRRYTE